MRKKVLLVTLLIFSLIGGIGFAFGGNIIFPPELHGGGVLNPALYLDDTRNNKAILVYKSSSSLGEYSVFSSCNTSSKLLASKKNLYFFEVDFSNDTSCRDSNVSLALGGDIVPGSTKKLTLKTSFDDMSVFLDYGNDDLLSFKRQLLKEQKKNSIYKNYNGDDVSRYFKYYIGQKKYYIATKRIELINSIIDGRRDKYISPVEGKRVSEIFTKIPNSPRPYRESYTDGIHHGWDIDGELGEMTVALDDGIIVRVVDGFDNASDFTRLIYTKPLSYEDGLKNLDILRGNQVWLKTMKGEVVFYSHLHAIVPGITVGSIVSKGDNLGTMGVSGVPAHDYRDYHLHFSIMENPYNSLKAGSYDFGDYMSWDWSMKGLSHKEMLIRQKEIFE